MVYETRGHASALDLCGFTRRKLDSLAGPASDLLCKLLLGLMGTAVSRRTILSVYPVLSTLSAGTDGQQTWHFTPHPSGQQLSRMMTFTGAEELYID